LDETGFAPITYRPYARAPKSQKVIGYRTAVQRPRTSLLGAYRQKRRASAEVTCNTVPFNEWLKNCLLPELTKPSLIILDSAASPITFNHATHT